MRTFKENKEISVLEARVIQYSKIFLALVFGATLIYYLHNINKSLGYTEEMIFDKVDSINITFV